MDVRTATAQCEAAVRAAAFTLAQKLEESAKVYQESQIAAALEHDKAVKDAYEAYDGFLRQALAKELK